jgi:transposase
MPMPPLTIKPHLTPEAVKQHYKSCKNPREKSYWHLIWLMVNPRKTVLVTEAAETVGFCENWARIIVHRYNKEGVDKFIDKRRSNKGRAPLLNKKQQKELRELLTQKKPEDGGLWTAPKVAKWIQKKTKKSITSVGAWKWIRKAGFTLQVPRPKHIQSANEEEMVAFKKKWLPTA